MLSALNTIQPYGADVLIEKHECINHMSKRMYKGLENAIKKPTTTTQSKDTKTKAKTSKAAVTTSLRGRGKLTGVRMKKWSQYYRNAIVKNAPNVEATQHAIWAIFYHSTSTTDSSPVWRVLFDACQFDAVQFGASHFDAMPDWRATVWRVFPFDAWQFGAFRKFLALFIFHVFFTCSHIRHCIRK